MSRSCCHEAGARRPVTAGGPRVTCDTLIRDDGSRFAIIASHADEPLDLKPELAEGTVLATLDGKQVGDTVATRPFSIEILVITTES